MKFGQQHWLINAIQVPIPEPRGSGIQFLKFEKVKIKVFIYDNPAGTTDRERAMLSALALHSYYDPQSFKDPSIPLAIFVGDFLTILCTYTEHVKISGIELAKALHWGDIEVVPTYIQTHKELDDLTKDIREKVARAMNLPSFDYDFNVFTIVAASTFTLMAKTVTKNNYDGGFTKYWRDLATAVNKASKTDGITAPKLEVCEAVHMSMSRARFNVRRECFLIIRTLAASTNNLTSAVFRCVMRSLEWAEMKHIWLINEEIFKKNPDIMIFLQFHRGEVSYIQKANAYLKSVKMEDRPFLKLLIDHDKLEMLNSRRFVYFNAAVQAILSTTQPNKRNIQTGATETIREFQRGIINYIDKRDSAKKWGIKQK